MVYKRYCDVCGAELPSYEEYRSPTGCFHFCEKSYDLCKCCGEVVGNFLTELKEKYTTIEALKKKLANMKGQKKLTDLT